MTAPWRFLPCLSCCEDSSDSGVGCPCSTVSNEWFVDFGSGGLTDNENTDDCCERIAGGFVLSFSGIGRFGSCRFTYLDLNWCGIDDCILALRIDLFVQFFGYELQAILGNAAPECHDPTGVNWDTPGNAYRLLFASNFQCPDPATLPEYLWMFPGACGGNWPSTVTIRGN